MTTFEKEMREFFKDDKLLRKKIFCDKMVAGSISTKINVKISFCNFGLADHYSGFEVQVINKEYGVIDTQTFRFSDIIDKKTTAPHLWVHGNDVSWSGGTFSDEQKCEIVSFIIHYLFLYI